jgi:type I restriction enzyme S subunit
MENPKIRFKGFTKDWEQRKLGEIATETYGGGTPKTSNEEFWKGDIPWIQSSDLIDECLFDVRPRKCISQEAVSKSATKLVPQNSIAIVTRVGVGKLAFMPFSYATSQDFLSLSGLKIDPEFTVYALYKMMQSVSNEVQGTSIKGVTKDELLAKKIIFPSCNEQKKIGAYLHSLDNLITLHQRKCEQTKKLKKYMLQKMFPQNGAKVPEIRFDGFTYDWEQRKLGDVFEQTSNLVNPKEDEIELWSLTVEDGLTKKSDRYNREFLVKKDDNFKEVRPGDIVYNPMNMTLGAVGYNGMAKSVAVSGYYTTMVAKENYDTYYINTWLKSPLAIRLYRTYATGSLIEKQRVQFPTLSIIPVTFPKYEEQTKIGSYFHSLDNLITLHQRKCDELKKMKKYMLQNMFI